MQLATFGQFTPALQRRLNTWYSVNNGNWSDPNTWMSNALDKKNVTQPRAGDNVYILHNVVLDYSTPIVNNLFIQGKLTWNGSTSFQVTVNGDLQVPGTLDLTQTTGSINFNLYGYNNYITNFTAGNRSTFTYIRAGDQNIMDLTYLNVTIMGIGKKYLVNNLTIPGVLVINNFDAANSFMECGPYNLTVNGTTSIFASNGVAGGNMGKSGTGNIIFKGLVSTNSNCVFSSSITNIEFQGGAALSGFSGSIVFNCPVTFTTANQTFSGNGSVFNNTMTIVGAITVNVTTSTTTWNGVVDGTVAGSTITNNGLINLGTTTLPMATTAGVFNYMTGAGSTIAYVMNGNYTLPYTTYANLQILGTGTKTLSGNTQINGALTISGFAGVNAKLDCSTFNLTVNGVTNIQDMNAELKGTSGTMLFKGLATWNTQSFSYTSSNILEFRAGVSFNGFGASISIGATINFTTANQNFTAGGQCSFTGNVTISGGITVAMNIGTTLLSAFPFTGTINGTSSSDILNNTGFTNYQNATAPMVTGKLYCNQVANTWVYGASGNQDVQVPSDPTTPGYKNLTLMGSGAKKLLGNVSVKGVYTLTSPATLDSNGFALTNP